MHEQRTLIIRGCDWNHSYGYDAAFNPTQWKSTSTNRSFNADNQETTGTNQFVHDGNGNPTTYGGVTTTWSVKDRLSGYGTGFTARSTVDERRARTTPA